MLDEGEARGQTEGGGRHDAEPQVPEGSGHHLVVLSGPGPVAQQSEDWGLLKMKMSIFNVESDAHLTDQLMMTGRRPVTPISRREGRKVWMKAGIWKAFWP